MKKFLFEILDKNHLYVNYSEIKDEEYEIDQNVIDFNNNFYNQSN